MKQHKLSKAAIRRNHKIKKIDREIITSYNKKIKFITSYGLPNNYVKKLNINDINKLYFNLCLEKIHHDTYKHLYKNIKGN